MRDDRGVATIEWVAAPSSHQRVELSLEQTGSRIPVLPETVKNRGYDPYSSGGPGNSTWNTAKPKLNRPVRTDLRKLSEHIKQVRALKDRKGDEG